MYIKHDVKIEVTICNAKPMEAMPPEQEEDDEEEDFSFPATTNAPPRFIGSPPLWRASWYSEAMEQEQGEHREPTSGDRTKMKLLSYITNKDGGASDEQMDVLWEDLNHEEEFRESRRKSDCMTLDPDHDRLGWGRRRRNMVKLGSVQSPLTLSKGGKRPGLMVFLNVWKKLFLLHQGSRH